MACRELLAERDFGHRRLLWERVLIGALPAHEDSAVLVARDIKPVGDVEKGTVPY